jgi:3-phenylpropionate/trans-cinnamate dioxygenase ferredoxin reductase component
MSRPTFVTIGAGQTAAAAARTLRRKGFDGRIVLIGDEAHAPYQRPPLSKEFLSGAEAEDALWLLPQRWLADNDAEIVTGVTVTRVDAATRTVECDGLAPLRADAVLFATGGSPRRLPVPGPRPDLVHYLRTLDDARRLAPLLKPGCRLAVIGAGFIGLEIAATAATAGVDVTVLEAAPLPLAGAIGPEMGAVVSALHRERGVGIRTGAAVESVRTTDDGVVIEIAGASAPLEADAVLIGIGITPNVAVAAASGLAVDDGIVVDAFGATAVSGIYAAGDVARRYSGRAGRHVRVEHFDNASRQGAAVAGAVLGRKEASDEAHWFWSDQFEHNMQLLGSARGVPVVRGDLDAKDFTAFFFDGPLLCGAFTIDRGDDISAAREMLDQPIDVTALTDEDTDIWDLALGVSA